MPHGNGYWSTSLGAYLPDDPVYVCEICDAESTDEDFLTEVGSELWVCPECLDDYTACEQCGSLTNYDDLIELNGNQYCADCAGEIQNDKSKEN